ncbi:hypothetical protein CC85DRAFT_111651 [Cutaneotrichosporon oleaginosum]|uniref:Uncharacterized protein n=1 Tax=Cutaneotrichosporon oleaginosum TaxID=879819 RepID=A0A0J0XX25_9TREE|nr:uncharacterized protein CC85DRAFT_111651 [Cutaneotrichosporon oleaginosum]KLT45616.1 hypothetical protein CC85DRAFT_111651 [Cutaneotrichosporon oleaginosum]TXT04588.1 hypothetical protein COLE_07407 [Cutaneotrichosporon oleaginosum]
MCSSAPPSPAHRSTTFPYKNPTHLTPRPLASLRPYWHQRRKLRRAHAPLPPSCPSRCPWTLMVVVVTRHH